MEQMMVQAAAPVQPRVQVSPEHERLSGGAGFFKGRRPLNALLVPFRASEKGPAARGRIPRILRLARHLQPSAAAQNHIRFVLLQRTVRFLQRLRHQIGLDCIHVSDLLTALSVLDTEVELYHAGRMPLEAFFALPRNREARDILTGIRIRLDGRDAACSSMRNTATSRLLSLV